MPSSELSRRRLLATGALAASTTVSLAGCASLTGPAPTPIETAPPTGDDWPAASFDARNTRYNPAATPPRSTPQVRWRRAFTHAHRPVVRGDLVVTVARQGDTRRRLYGLHAADGTERWHSTSEPWGFEPPVIGTERAYVTGVDYVFGVDRKMGTETWRGRPPWGANTASPTLADGRLYLEHGGYFSALDDTGRVTWAATNDAQGSPAIVDDRAYVATAFTVAAVDLTTPAREWPWEDGDEDEPPHATTEAARLWQSPTEPRIAGRRAYDSPAIDGDTVYATYTWPEEPGGELAALDRATGDEGWTVASPSSRQSAEGRDDAPSPVSEAVPPVVTSSGVLTALGDRVLRDYSTAGQPGWRRTLDHNIVELAGAGDTLLVVTHNRSVATTSPAHSELRAFDLEEGTPLWSHSFADHIEGIALAGDTIYATVITGRDSNGDVTATQVMALT